MTGESKVDVICVWFTYEANFHLEGYENKQKLRIWGIKSPSMCLAKPLDEFRIYGTIVIDDHSET